MIRSRKKAMTLIELIIVMGILVVIMGATSTFFISNYKSLNNAEDKADLQHAAQSVVNEFSYNVLNGKKITLKDNATSVKLIDLNSGNVIFEMRDGSSKEYNLSGGQFKKSPDQIVSSNIKSIEINIIDDGDGLYMKVAAGLGQKTETIETKLYFRKELTYTGGSNPNGGNNTILIDGNYESSENKEFYGDVYIKGNIILKDRAKLNVNGNVYVNGNVILEKNSNLDVKGDLYLEGNVELKDNAIINGNVEYGGNIDKNSKNKITGDKRKNNKLTPFIFKFP